MSPPFNSIAPTCLKEWKIAGVHFVALPETNISSTSTASVSSISQRFGWQMVQFPKPGKKKNKAGVVFLCREPLGLVLKKIVSTPEEQFLIAEVHEAQRVVTVISFYRRYTDHDMNGLTRPNLPISSEVLILLMLFGVDT